MQLPFPHRTASPVCTWLGPVSVLNLTTRTLVSARRARRPWPLSLLSVGGDEEEEEEEGKGHNFAREPHWNHHNHRRGSCVEVLAFTSIHIALLASYTEPRSPASQFHSARGRRMKLGSLGTRLSYVHLYLHIRV